MKTRLFYFSGTGNSLVVARDLAAALGDADIASIPDALRQGMAGDADRVGIVFPVYMFGLPLIVADFCRRVNVPAAAYLFGVATYGGMPGGALPQMAGIFKKRGLKLAAGFGVRMPGNYTPLYGAPSDAAQQAMFVAGKERVARITDVVRGGRPGPIDASNAALNLFFHSFMYRFGAPRIPGMDKDFRATDKCNACGVCAKVCPVGNIKMKDGRPEWQHRCEQCLACLQWCPTEAIELGKRTAGRRRYHHPAVNAGDIAPTAK